MFGGSSQLTITAEHCFAKRWAQRFDYSPLGSSRKLGGAAEHLIDGSERRICPLSFFTVRLLLKGAVTCFALNAFRGKARALKYRPSSFSARVPSGERENWGRELRLLANEIALFVNSIIYAILCFVF